MKKELRSKNDKLRRKIRNIGENQKSKLGKEALNSGNEAEENRLLRENDRLQEQLLQVEAENEALRNEQPRATEIKCIKCVRAQEMEERRIQLKDQKSLKIFRTITKEDAKIRGGQREKYFPGIKRYKGTRPKEQ